jgi:hypothetical protein
MKDSVVFVSYIFPPYNSIAAQRSVKLVGFFLQYFETVYVLKLADKDIPKKKIDRQYNNLYANNPRVKIIDVPLKSFGYEDPQLASLPGKLISGFLTRALCSNGYFWLSPLRQTIEQLVKAYNISLLFVTGPPFLPFVVAKKIKEKFNIPYIIDYRDLWTTNPRTPAFGIARKIIGTRFEKKILLNAKAVLTVSNGCAKSLSTFSRVTRLPLHVIMNIPDKKYNDLFLQGISQRVKNNNLCRLVLTGSIYPNCTFWPILDIMSSMTSSEKNRFVFCYCGPSSALVKKEFEQYGFATQLIDRGMLTKDEAIKELYQADVLVSLIDDGKRKFDDTIAGLMTTKIFDYFLSGKKILNIGPKVSDVNTFAYDIKYTDYFSFEAGDREGIKYFLLDCLENNLNDRSQNNELSMPFFENYHETLAKLI